jgi:GAF domain-containing protein
MTTPVPVNPTAQQDSPVSFSTWRARFLQRILRIALFAGVPLLLITFMTPTANVLRIIYSILFVLLLGANLLPIPHQLKAFLFLMVLLSLGICGLFENGLRGDSRVWLVAFVSVSALLFGNRISIIANGICVLVMAIFGFLVITGNIHLLSITTDIGTIFTWIVAILVNFGISALVSTGISQLGIDFEKAQYSSNNAIYSLQMERVNLGNLVKEQTATLEYKASQLQAAAIVARDTAEFQDVNSLLSRTVDLIASQFNLYHAGIFLLDDSGDNVILQAASSEGGKKMLERGHKLARGQQGIVGAVAYENRSRVVMNMSTDTTFYNNPDLPLTCSEAAFPLTVRNEVIGVLDIQASTPDAFSHDDIDLFQSVADQIATAIQNARLIGETRNALKRLEIAGTEGIQQIWKKEGSSDNWGYRYTPFGITPVDPQTNVLQSASRNQISIPITLRGLSIGNITLSRRDELAWSDSDRSLAVEIGNQIGLALENARLLEDAQRRASFEQMIGELSSTLSRTLNPDALLQITIKELHRLPNVEEVTVFINPEDKPSINELPIEKG